MGGELVRPGDEQFREPGDCLDRVGEGEVGGVENEGVEAKSVEVQAGGQRAWMMSE